MKTTSKTSWLAAAQAVQRLLKSQGGPVAAVAVSPLKDPVAVQTPPPQDRRDLPPLDFVTGEAVSATPAVEPALEAQESPSPQPDSVYRMLEDPVLQRVRDQYVAVRFAGVARSSMDLVDVRRTIVAAHTYFEDGNGPLAAELLELAAAIQPAAEKLWLAALELALRMGDAEGYRRAAIGLRQNHPETPAWKEVAALARTLCLTDDPFSSTEGTETTDTGPGPKAPNWLRDGWELTPEFTHADVRAQALGEDESTADGDCRRAA